MQGNLRITLTLTQLQTLNKNINKTFAKPTHANTRVEIHTDVFHELSVRLATLLLRIKAAAITVPIKLGCNNNKKTDVKLTTTKNK